MFNRILDYILDFIIILLVIILLIPISYEKEKESNKEVKMDYITKLIYDEKEIEGLKISVSPVINYEDNYNIEVTILNTKETVFNLNGISLIIYDVDHNKVKSISNFNIYSISSKESIILLIPCDKDLIKDGYTVEYRPFYTVME